MKNEICVFKPTQDDWCGSFELVGWLDGVQNQMLVEVCFHGNISPPDSRPPVWRTSVWGNDDCGMEVDCATEAEAFNLFLQVIGWKFVNRDQLKALGFVSA